MAYGDSGRGIIPEYVDKAPTSYELTNSLLNRYEEQKKLDREKEVSDRDFNQRLEDFKSKFIPKSVVIQALLRVGYTQEEISAMELPASMTKEQLDVLLKAKEPKPVEDTLQLIGDANFEKGQKVATSKEEDSSGVASKVIGQTGKYKVSMDKKTGKYFYQYLGVPDKKEKTAAESLDLTPGEKKIDEEFAKDISDWTTGGGRPKIASQLKQLEGVVEKLGKNSNLTGPAISLMSDSVRKRVNPESAQTERLVKQIIQQSLKEILGAQFTQQEAQQLLERSYDIALEEQYNAETLKATITQLTNAANLKDEAAKYFRANRSLKGFDYSKIKSLVYEDIAPPTNTPATASQPKTVVKKEYSPSANKTRFTYSDNTVEIKDGKI